MLLSAVFAEDKFCASVLLLKHKDLLHCVLLLSMQLRPLFSVCGWANSSSSQFSSLSALAAEQCKNLSCHLFNYFKHRLAW